MLAPRRPTGRPSTGGWESFPIKQRKPVDSASVPASRPPGQWVVEFIWRGRRYPIRQRSSPDEPHVKRRSTMTLSHCWRRGAHGVLTDRFGYWLCEHCGRIRRNGRGGSSGARLFLRVPGWHFVATHIERPARLTARHHNPPLCRDTSRRSRQSSHGPGCSLGHLGVSATSTRAL